MYYHWSKWYGYEEHPCPKWWMLDEWRWLNYRRQKVQQERRRWFRDIEEDVKLRNRRAPRYLERWGNLEKYPTCYNMKSWKKLTKFKKQYQKNL